MTALTREGSSYDEKLLTSEKNKGVNTGGARIFTTQSLEYDECEKFLPLVDGSVVYVIRAYDGDTATVGFLHPSTGTPVRLSCRIVGIDTPELRGSTPGEKKLGLLAKKRLQDVIVGEFVTIVGASTEKFNRVLCDLKTDTIESVSQYMLEDPSICKKYDGGKKASWDC